MSTLNKDAPSLPEKRAAGTSLAPHITATAIQPWQSAKLDRRLGAPARLLLKLELFQRTGKFKVRAAAHKAGAGAQSLALTEH